MYNQVDIQAKRRGWAKATGVSPVTQVHCFLALAHALHGAKIPYGI